MKKTLLILLVLCAIAVSGCDSEPIDYKARAKEATVVNMSMYYEKGGARYTLTIEEDNGTRYQVTTDAILFHQITFGTRVLITGDCFGPTAVAVVP